MHVPYCRERCLYCDFALVPVERAPSRPFVDRLADEIVAFAEREVAPGIVAAPRFRGRRAASVYLGGGTPSLLEPAEVDRLLGTLDRVFGIENGAEVTLEANPEDADLQTLRAFRAAGANRLSLGVQALDDRFLRALGRKHDRAQGERAVDLARAAGFERVSIDLIFGVEGMTIADWEETLERAVALSPDHLSCYGLTVERGTVLEKRIATGRLRVPDDDVQASMFELAGRRLAAEGLPRYEISNYAPPGRRAVHNSLYWRYAEWIGFGPSAHSFARLFEEPSPDAGGVRWWNDRSVDAWLRGGGTPGHEVVRGRAAMGEMAFTAMRTADGLSESAFEAVFGIAVDVPFGETFVEAERRGLVERRDGHVRLTERGFPIADSVFADLVEAA